MKIENEIEIEVKNKNSRITFERPEGSTWKVWDRFISIDKEKLYHIGNVCGTCEFFFLKQEKNLEINFNKEILISELNNGELKFDSESINKLSKLIPNGKYLVLETEINPQLVTIDSGNNYFTNEQREAWRYEEFDVQENNKLKFNNYFREDLVDFGKLKYEHKHGFINFFVPLYPTKELNNKRVEFYSNEIENGKKPIIISIGVLDVKTSEEYPEINGKEIEPEFGTHWCLANYIIDGHHKLMAAAKSKKPIKLITFISREESWQLIDEMKKEIKTAWNKV